MGARSPYSRHLWDPLEQFFEQKGYILFIASKKYNAGIGPKDENEVRSPDPYHHVLPDDQTRYLIKYLTYVRARDIHEQVAMHASREQS